jgi:hypothetical protein
MVTEMTFFCPPGPFTPAFAYFYFTSSSGVPPNNNVPFTLSGPNSSSITIDSTKTIITIGSPGVYEIMYLLLLSYPGPEATTQSAYAIINITSSMQILGSNYGQQYPPQSDQPIQQILEGKVITRFNMNDQIVVRNIGNQTDELISINGCVLASIRLIKIDN